MLKPSETVVVKPPKLIKFDFLLKTQVKKTETLLTQDCQRRFSSKNLEQRFISPKATYKCNTDITYFTKSS